MSCVWSKGYERSGVKPSVRLDNTHTLVLEESGLMNRHECNLSGQQPISDNFCIFGNCQDLAA